MPSPKNDTPEMSDTPDLAIPVAKDAPLSDRLASLSPAQKELLRKKLAQRGDQLSGKERSVSPSKRSPSTDPANTAIAIVGMGCRLPGAPSPDAYWDLIERAGEAVGPIPAERWQKERFFDPTGRSRGKMHVDAIGALADVDRFDPAFFGISPREASRMDPQQRLLLEVTWEAFENAGIPIDSAAGSQTGVFIGIGGTDYSKVPSRYPDFFEHIDAHIGTGNALSIAAGRISYLFDFRGPSFIVDTACSSALVAIHSAIVSLSRGECNAAVAGGVNLILSPETTIAFSKARMLSPDGHCRPFDDSANGYVRGEGCGIVLLKRLADATAAGDQILGVIRGSAVNQDGRTSGITAPSGQAQQRVIHAAIRSADLTIDDISYVEAHGTGTPLGDPIELMALQEVFSRRSSGLPAVRLGSVKANIGHTETVSGIAGLLKVLQMFRHRTIPAQTNFQRINSNARLSSSALQIADMTQPWDPIGGRRVAGISSFGFGGTNAHLVVECPDPESADSHPSSDVSKMPPTLALPISASNPEALNDLARRYAELLENASDDVAHQLCGSATVGRSSLSRRAVFLGTDASTLLNAVRQLAPKFEPTALAAGNETPAIATPAASAVGSENGRNHDRNSSLTEGQKSAGRRTKIAMLFTGQGSQYVSMATRLRDSLPSFAMSLQECAETLDQHLPVSLAQMLDGKTSEGVSIDHTSLAQGAICAVQCALVDSLRDVGITADVVAGHSIGEIAALYAAGALSKQDALRIAAYRGQAMGRLPEGGSMASLFTSVNRVRDWLAKRGSSVVVAAMNGRGSTVIAGDEKQVEAILKIAEQHDVSFRRLSVSHAFHSPQMEPAAQPLRTQLESFFDSARIPRQVVFLSSLTGQRLSENIDIDYWIRHLMEPVRFTDVMEQLAKQKVDLAIEVGPTPQLTGMLLHGGYTGESEIRTVSTLAPKKDDFEGWTRAVASAWSVGARVDWKSYQRMFPSRRVSLPTYPFQRERYWYDPPGIGNQGSGDSIIHPLLGSSQSLASGMIVYSSVIRDTDPSYIADHVVSGSITVPAAAWIETLRAAAQQSFPEGFELQDIEIHRALFLEPNQAASLQTSVEPLGQSCKISIHWRGNDPDSAWQPCASAVAIGGIHSLADRVVPATLSDPQRIEPTEFYRTLASAKLEYGGFFQVLENIVCKDNVASASLKLSEPLTGELSRYHLHPTLLDGALQLIAAAVPSTDTDTGGEQTYLPVGVRSLVVFCELPIHAARIRLNPSASTHQVNSVSDELIADVDLLSDGETIVAQLRGVRLKSLRRDSVSTTDDPHQWVYKTTWENVELNSPGSDESERPSQQVWTMGSGDVFAETADLLRTIQQAIRCEPATTLSIVTRGAFSIDADDVVDPTATALAALTRVAANEHPQLAIRLLDVHPSESIELIEAWLGSDVHETEIALRNDRWFAPRLASSPELLLGSGDQANEIRLPDQGAYRIRLDGSHRTEGLWSRRIAALPADAGEVTLEVRAAGLNFSDVLKAMGLYPGVRDKEVPLGIEVCGTVTKIGEGVQRFAIGDRVMGVVRYGFASDDSTADYLLVKVPEQLSDDEAASIPIVFLTAHYALCRVGKLQPGESVLIHAGAGGVGLAAIQVAHACGATVFTTAGSDEKRNLLAELGVDPANIFDSRDVRSLQRLKERTGGRGVDVVLNSLPGEWIDRSLELLAPRGRFLEIGKTDIYQNRAIGLSPFQENLTYSAIDLDRLLRNRSDEITELFDEIAERFRSEVYQPLPITSYSMSELPSAMRFMAARRNIGKIVVVPPRKRADVAAQDGVHLITGGSGAIATAVARRLIERGARHVALLGRSQISQSTVQLQQWAAEQNADCFYLQADCTDEATLSAAIGSLPTPAGKIVSVIHAAGTLEDSLVHELSEESLRRVLEPKVCGAIALDRATADHPIKNFQMLGSVAMVFGSPGQSNYAAANGFLEGFAAERRKRGFPASVVHWGPWASAGMADDSTRQRNLKSRGLSPLDVSLATDLLIDGLAESTPASAIVVDANFSSMLSGTPKANLPSVLRSLQANQNDSSGSKTSLVDASFLSTLDGIAEEERTERLRDYFADQLGRILSMDASAIDPAQPLGALGLDSLMAIELKNTIEAKIDITLPISRFMSDPSLQSLAEAAAEIRKG